MTAELHRQRVLNFLEGLLDIEHARLRDMDENGVDMQLLSLTAPGVQMFDSDTACELATLANDRLAEVISRHPTRFSGLAAIASRSAVTAGISRSLTLTAAAMFIADGKESFEDCDMFT